MQFTRYFSRNRNIDIPCSKSGIFEIDEATIEVFEKRNEPLSKSSIEQSLMSSYKNRSAILEDVIVTRNGRLYKNNQLIGEIVGCKYDDIKDSRMLDPNIYNNVISISGIWTNGIWHFPCEAFCGLMKHKITEDMKIHVHTKTPYVLYWLSLLGIKDQQVIDGNIRVKKLLIPELGAPGQPYPEQIDWLHNILKKSIDIYPDNLLIVIRRRNSRPILNHDEVYKRCHELAINKGLKIYVHDDNKLPSIKTQHSLFKCAKILVAPHGGGNVNLLAMDKNTTFVEIIDKSWPNICFMRLAYHRNINYYSVSSVDGNANIERLENVFKKISNK